MYTIVMRDNKMLETTIKTSIFQREKLADKIQFLLPQTCGDLDIANCTAVLKYMDQLDVAHVEVLTMDDELYKGMLRFVLPLDTKITQYAGDIKVRITLTHVDLDTGVQQVMHTGATTITIKKMEDYFHFNPDKSLEFIDQLLGKMDTRIQFMQEYLDFFGEGKADDVMRVDDEDGAKIQLTSNGNPIGNPVSIDQEEIMSVSFDDEFPDES